jgi:hypothetical protein
MVEAASVVGAKEGDEARPFGDDLVKHAKGSGFHRIVRIADDGEAADFLTAMSRVESSAVEALQKLRRREAWVWRIVRHDVTGAGHAFVVIRGVFGTEQQVQATPVLLNGRRS